MPSEKCSSSRRPVVTVTVAEAGWRGGPPTSAVALTWRLLGLAAALILAGLGVLWFVAAGIAKPMRLIAQGAQLQKQTSVPVLL